MDLNLLDRLSTDALKAMQKRIGELLASRLDTRPLPGRKATFVDRNGAIRTVRIEKYNRTTYSCVEIHPNDGQKWRISAGALKVEPIERKTPMPIAPAIKPAKPMTTSDDAW